MTEVTLYLRRETIKGPFPWIIWTLDSGGRIKANNDLGRYLWRSLGLPDQDGEHRVKVVLDDG